MPEREMLEREIHRLRQIIRADSYAQDSRSTTVADKVRGCMCLGVVSEADLFTILEAARWRPPPSALSLGVMGLNGN
jgi:hypothetical protein